MKAVGRATDSTRTPDQTAAAEYWGMTNATATMASIIRSVANGQGGTLADHARLFARAYTNAADALIVTWRDKARYSFWRPITAIREAASDGNDATEADPDWTSLIAAPPYPEHPCGLATFGSAVVDTMQHFYGRDEATFSGTTAGGVTRGVHELLAAARRHRRRPYLVRRPLPVRRHRGREDRTQGRPLGQPARLPLIRRRALAPDSVGARPRIALRRRPRGVR